MITICITMRFYYQEMTKECIYSLVEQIHKKLPFTSGGIIFYKVIKIEESIYYTEITIEGRASAEFVEQFISTKGDKYND